MKLTDWFPVAVKPARPGWYEGKYSDGSGADMFWFDGSVWRYGPHDTASLFGSGERYGGLRWNNDFWRGLAEKPE